jgi:hypothetical protein
LVSLFFQLFGREMKQSKTITTKRVQKNQRLKSRTRLLQARLPFSSRKKNMTDHRPTDGHIASGKATTF